MTSSPSDFHAQSPRAPLRFLGLACAVGVSSLYYNQPLLLEMANTFHTTPGRTGFVAVATQVGYAVGLLLFVPLGDIVERRSLIMRLFGAVAVALLFVAFARSLPWLILASIAAGALAAVTHVVLPIAPDLVDDNQRGRAIGTVMTGLLLGILLARTFAGWVSNIHGWRYVFVAAAVMNASFVPMIWRALPKLPPKQPMRYPEAMVSLWTLFRTQPQLREACAIGGLVFASFSCFWTTLAFLLHSHYGLGAGVAGTFGLVGAAGAFVAGPAGRAADERGPRWVVRAGILILAASYIFLWVQESLLLSTPLHVAALVLGVLVLDLGAQATMVANQTRIFGLVPSARSRLNTVYMFVYFSGAAAGSALATVAWTHFQWNGVCVLALLLVGLAAIRHATGLPEQSPQTTQQTREAVSAD